MGSHDKIDPWNLAGGFLIAGSPTSRHNHIGVTPIPLLPDHRKPHSPPNGLTALAGGGHRHAACIDDSQRRGRGIRFDPPTGSQQRGHLLAFVLIYLAAQSLDGKRPHRVDGSIAKRSKVAKDVFRQPTSRKTPDYLDICGNFTPSLDV